MLVRYIKFSFYIYDEYKRCVLVVFIRAFYSYSRINLKINNFVLELILILKEIHNLNLKIFKNKFYEAEKGILSSDLF